jgi:hypothetical protein
LVTELSTDLFEPVENLGRPAITEGNGIPGEILELYELKVMA